MRVYSSLEFLLFYSHAFVDNMPVLEHDRQSLRMNVAESCRLRFCGRWLSHEVLFARLARGTTSGSECGNCGDGGIHDCRLEELELGQVQGWLIRIARPIALGDLWAP